MTAPTEPHTSVAVAQRRLMESIARVGDAYDAEGQAYVALRLAGAILEVAQRIAQQPDAMHPQAGQVYVDLAVLITAVHRERMAAEGGVHRG